MIKEHSMKDRKESKLSLKEEKLEKIDKEIAKLRAEIAKKEIRLGDLEEHRAAVEASADGEVDDNLMKPGKVYSGYAGIPSGHASERIVRGCLVVEGGAFRGAYDSGVLDRLMTEDINLECTIGVSAGALTGMNYVSGQIGRSARVNLGYRHDKRYVGLKPFRKEASIVGFSFLYDTYEEIEPFDMEWFKRRDHRFIAVVTNMLTGKAEFFERGKCRSIKRAVKASASMPLVTRPTVMDGVPYLDGGCADKIPFDWALEQGFEKIIVIRTREKEYRKKPVGAGEKRAMELLYHEYPEFLRTALESNDMYNRQCDELDALAAAGRVLVLDPGTPVTVGRLESDMEKLGALYWQGYNETGERLDAIKEYLEIS